MNVKDNMIEALVTNDLHDWYTPGDKDAYLALILTEGFSGYKNQDISQLMDEIKQRELVPITPNKSCSTCELEETYVCIACEHDQVLVHFGGGYD